MLDCQERDRADKIAIVPESPPHLENSAPRLAVSEHIECEPQRTHNSFIFDESARLQQSHRFRLNSFNIKPFGFEQQPPLRDGQRPHAMMNDTRERSLDLLPRGSV